MTTEEILHSSLTDEQYAAVIDDSRNILCLACAGSGKSRTLAYKIAYLISKGEAPESIIAFTFTEKAAESIKRRVAEALRKFGLSENKVQISTLSDIIWVLLQMNESNELRYELDINNKLPGDIETETQKWYAGLRFYGNDPEHSLNADMCNFLADLQENRESLESYSSSVAVMAMCSSSSCFSPDLLS